MLEKIKKNIKNYRKVKYKKILFLKNDINLRSQTLNYILNLKKKENNEIDCECCKFYKKNLNLKNFIIFYNKFNSNIQLKAKYDLRKFKKKTNKNACFKSYILFSNFLMKNKKVNNIQKLNTILKLNDLLILIFKENQHSNLIKDFKKNINFEKRLLQLYI